VKKTFVRKVKEQLLMQRKELTGKTIRNHGMDVVDIDGDETDEIQGTMLIELNNQLYTRNNSKLAQIDGALQRIDEKTYGLCEDCGEDILEKRLLINPYFLTCISCAEEREAENKKRGFGS
jgi:DnaK suppressor protein